MCHSLYIGAPTPLSVMHAWYAMTTYIPLNAIASEDEIRTQLALLMEATCPNVRNYPFVQRIENDIYQIYNPQPMAWVKQLTHKEPSVPANYDHVQWLRRTIRQLSECEITVIARVESAKRWATEIAALRDRLPYEPLTAELDRIIEIQQQCDRYEKTMTAVLSAEIAQLKRELTEHEKRKTSK
jgi:hypothetical protein